MGQELVITWCPCDYEGDQVYENIAALSHDKLIESYSLVMELDEVELYQDMFGEADIEENESDDTLPPTLRYELAERIREITKEYYDYILENWRMVTVAEFDGRNWFIAGGSSWGDPPEGFDELQLLAQLGVTYDYWDHSKPPPSGQL